MLAALIALRWSGPRDTSTLLRHLCFALAGVSAILTAVDFLSHDLSGLNREDFQTEVSNGLVHPTSAGATGSLGVVILISARLLWGWTWVRAFLLPGLLACTSSLDAVRLRTGYVIQDGGLFPHLIARSNTENRIEEQQLGLFADRTSCHAYLANTFRVLLAAAAHVLVEHIRSR